MPVTDLGNKFCSSCKLLKTLGEFNKYKNRKCGRQRYCRVCYSKYYQSNKSEINEKAANYVKNKLATNSEFKAHLGFRRLTKKFRTSGCDDDEVDAHRLVSRETYLLWLSYQRELKDVKGPEHIDHCWPESKLDPHNPYHKLIGTNVVNFSPMNKIDNIKKSNKIIPELLLEQITVAERFVSEIELSDEEKLKFWFLTMVYSDFIHSQLENLLKQSGILDSDEIQE